MDTAGTPSIRATPPFGRWLGVIGVGCLFAPLVGLILTVGAMIHDFNILAGSGSDTDPAVLSHSIGQALVAIAIGYVVGLFGIGLVCAAIFGFHFKPPWLRKTLVGASILWLPAFPLGTAIGVAALILLHLQRQFFTVEPNGPPPLD